jgi:hypothetical protein
MNADSVFRFGTGNNFRVRRIVRLPYSICGGERDRS